MWRVRMERIGALPTYMNFNQGRLIVLSEFILFMKRKVLLLCTIQSGVGLGNGKSGLSRWIHMQYPTVKWRFG
jgi:hypothetical protein